MEAIEGLTRLLLDRVSSLFFVCYSGRIRVFVYAWTLEDALTDWKWYELNSWLKKKKKEFFPITHSIHHSWTIFILFFLHSQPSLNSLNNQRKTFHDLYEAVAKRFLSICRSFLLIKIAALPLEPFYFLNRVVHATICDSIDTSIYDFFSTQTFFSFSIGRW